MIDSLAPEKVRFGSYLWRDRVLIVLNLLVVLGSFLLSWASRNYYAPSQLSSSPAWLLFILYLHVFLAGIVLPLAHIGMEFKHPNQAASKLLYLFQHPRTLTLLLFEFAVTQIILLTTGSSLKEPSPAFLFAYIIFFLVFMWHVYGRDKIDFASLVLTNAWMLMLSDTRSLIADHGFKDFYPLVVSNMMWVALWIGFACLLTLPYLALLPKARQRLKKLDSRLTRFQSYLLLSIAAACFVPYASIGGPATSFFYWIGVIIAAPMLGLLLTKDKLHLAPQSWTLSARTYKLCLAAILGVYLILAFITARSTLWQSNPDMYAYFQIARGYAQGMFPIRGYWSPLMSWALAGPMRVGIDPHVAERAGVILIGFLWIYASLLLATRFELNRLSRLALVLAMALFILNFGFFPLAPDLLAATFTTVFFYLITDARLITHPIRFGIVMGSVGTLAYFTKYYNLPFLLVYVVVFAGVLAIHVKRFKPVMLGCIVCILTMILLAAPWTLAVSQRYGVFASSTDGLINRFTPTDKNYGHGCLFTFLCDQPRDIMFPWEDPLPQYYPDLHWSAFSSIANFQLEINALGVSLLKFLEQWPLGRLPLIAFAIFTGGIFVVWKDNQKRLLFIWAFFTIFLQTAGYFYSGYLFANDVEMRFHFSIIPILIVTVLYLAQRVFASTNMTFRGGSYHIQRGIQIAITFYLALSFSPLHTTFQLPIGDQLNQISKDPLGLPEPLPCEQLAATEIREALVEPIAGTDFLIMSLSYYAQKKTYGMVAWPSSRIPTDFETQLQTIGIQTPKSIAQLDKELHDMGVRTLVATERSGLSSPLRAQFGYKLAAKRDFCGQQISILYVPDEGLAIVSF